MIYLDVDGVICDWNFGFAKLAKKKYPTTDYVEFQWGNKVVEPRSVWSYRMSSFFWSELPKFSYADLLIRTVEKYDPNFKFLTSSPLDSNFHTGRARWVERELGANYLKKLVICCGDKSFCAKKGDLLVDDKKRNILDFKEKGAEGFLWKTCTELGGKGLKEIDRLERFILELKI